MTGQDSRLELWQVLPSELPSPFLPSSLAFGALHYGHGCVASMTRRILRHWQRRQVATEMTRAWESVKLIPRQLLHSSHSCATASHLACQYLNWPLNLRALHTRALNRTRRIHRIQDNLSTSILPWPTAVLVAETAAFLLRTWRRSRKHLRLALNRVTPMFLTATMHQPSSSSTITHARLRVVHSKKSSLRWEVSSLLQEYQSSRQSNASKASWNPRRSTFALP